MNTVFTSPILHLMIVMMMTTMSFVLKVNYLIPDTRILV